MSHALPGHLRPPIRLGSGVLEADRRLELHDARFDNLFMAAELRACSTCPGGEEIVTICSSCRELINDCACLAGNFRRTFIDPDTYDPDTDPFIWNLEL